MLSYYCCFFECMIKLSLLSRITTKYFVSSTQGISVLKATYEIGRTVLFLVHKTASVFPAFMSIRQSTHKSFILRSVSSTLWIDTLIFLDLVKCAMCELCQKYILGIWNVLRLKLNRYCESFEPWVTVDLCVSGLIKKDLWPKKNSINCTVL